MTRAHTCRFVVATSGPLVETASTSGPLVATGRSKRRGGVLVVVLVSLLVVIMLAGALFQAVVARQRQTRNESRRMQAQWLAESALERGAAQLHKDADYKGETWTVSAEELSSTESGTAVLRVEPVEGNERRKKLFVEAVYPDDPHRRVQVRKEVVVEVRMKDEG